MRLQELAAALPGRFVQLILGDPGTAFESLSYDSRQVFAGVLFVCLKGERADGHEFRADAKKRGAVGFVIDRGRLADFESLGLPVLAVDDTRKGLPYLSAAFYHHPSRDLNLIGVTGTNGKTTTTYMMAAILRAAGVKTAVIGTVGAQVDGQPFPVQWTVSTTPESLDLQQFFAQMRDEQVGAVVMEVTSIAIDQERTAAAAFDTAIFTNLTQDHLDYHGSMENYKAAKERMFTEYPALGGKEFLAVVNADDPAGEDYGHKAAALGHRVARYAVHAPDADYLAQNVLARADGTDFTVVEAKTGQTYPITLNIGGLFNVSNALGAIAAARERGVPITAVRAGLASLANVPGRFEPVSTGERGFHVLVDYAHTPDGLENVLRSARALEPKRLLVVFGAGGNRDRTKRPKMGRIAVDLADRVIVTSDNPRKEDPDFIIREILEGIEGGRDNTSVVVEPDRRAAIQRALCDEARSGDLIVIAGKGHETYQIVGDETFPFDDRQVAREVLDECAGR